MPDIYDLVVIGAGPGGFTAAEHAAKRGAKVAIIKKMVGEAPVPIGVAFPPRPSLHAANPMQT